LLTRDKITSFAACNRAQRISNRFTQIIASVRFNVLGLPAGRPYTDALQWLRGDG
jgi:hypothetical protein